MSNSVLYDVPGPKARRRSFIISIIGGVVIAAGVAWLIAGLAAPRVSVNGAVSPSLLDPSRWDIFTDVQLWLGVGDGVLATLRMAAVAAVLALTLGVLFCFGRTSDTKWIRIPTSVLLEFFRGIPVLLLMLFTLLVFSTGAYWAGVIGLGIYNGAIIGEALRAGVKSLPKGQRESGLAIGLTPVQTRLKIEFPQAFRQMLPIIIAQLVVLLKDTSLAYVIAYPELLRRVMTYLSNYYGNNYQFSLFVIVLAIYLAMNLSLSWLARVVARRTAGGAKGKRGRKDEPVIDMAKLPDAGMGGGVGPL
ncbi:glutamate transport system permease protein [Conyzicola lurida]|uniref:Glutamate transport system permease protein n=1 Tax=Conyzicola lurida TaxID=1172621 RepID=A0A841AL41_9MICO|nr:amino acid ABC transporter permease [Conyzicola lurida]MBB5842363.1 glutamate transport system permease protein [Conyzicola lurida]